MLTCQISLGREARIPPFGLDGWTRFRGRRQRYKRTSRYQVQRDAETFPSRWASRAKVPVGTCRYSSEMTISLIVAISAVAS